MGCSTKFLKIYKKKMSEADWGKVAKKLDLKFEDVSNLRSAFIHRSYLNESQEKESNERLEFLGDAVLELASTEFLFEKFPEKQEGEMTALRAALVRKENLAETAQKLGLGEWLLLSKGEERSLGREKDYLLANTVEAVIGAIYLEGGWEVANKFILKNVLGAVDKILKEGLHIDAKSFFQEMAQAKRSVTPNYKLENSEGPDHDKMFVMGAFLGDKKVGEGKGSSKQCAEEAAAKNAVEELGWK